MTGRTSETGETGEHLVLAELYRRGVLGGQVARGASSIDLLTSTRKTIQVKAKRGTGRWVLGLRDRRPAVDLVVLVTVGEQHRADEFYVVPVDEPYDIAECRHDAYWKTRPDSTSGERHLLQLKDSDSKREPELWERGIEVREFLPKYRDNWEPILEPEPPISGAPR